MVSQLNPHLEELDFRSELVELQLNMRHARQLIVQLEINIINLSFEVGCQPGLASRSSVRLACGCSTSASLFHVESPVTLRP
jgi:hypothetical protein